MRRSIAGILLSLFMCILLPAQAVSAAESLIPGGQIIGIALEDGSVTVAAFDETLGEATRAAGLEVGDRITHIDGKQVASAMDVRKALERADGTVDIRLERNGKERTLALKPAVTPDGPRLGVFLKQGVTGVGTLTWYDPESGQFGALGHGVNDPQGKPVTMIEGTVYDASVASVEKGRVGNPGQLAGSVEDSTPIGSVCKNTPQGIFGTCPTHWAGEPIPLAEPEEIRTGPATIRSTIQGTRTQEYSVEILKIYPSDRQTGRNLLLQVTDPALLTATGGIVQGMSGSPIIQDGKLVGAVTHVLVNDPTTGYGIFIENMLDAAA